VPWGFSSPTSFPLEEQRIVLKCTAGLHAEYGCKLAAKSMWTPMRSCVRFSIVDNLFYYRVQIKVGTLKRCFTVWMSGNPTMRFKHALTKGDLTSTQDHNPGSPKVRTLFLGSGVTACAGAADTRLFRQSLSSTAPTLANSLCKLLKDECAIQEYSKLLARS